MRKTFILMLVLLLALAIFAGCDARNGRVTNSPNVTVTPGNTPGHTPTVTDVPAPTATHTPSAAPGTASPDEEPPVTTPPTANATAAYGF